MIHRASAGRSLGLLILGLMWRPGVSGLLTRLAFQGNLRGHGFGSGQTKYQFASYWIPLLYSSIVYVPFWLAGYFDPENRALNALIRLLQLPHAAASHVVTIIFYAKRGELRAKRESESAPQLLLNSVD